MLIMVLHLMVIDVWMEQREGILNWLVLLIIIHDLLLLQVLLDLQGRHDLCSIDLVGGLHL